MISKKASTLLLCASPLLALSATAQAAWVDTATKAMPLAASYSNLGKAPDSMPMHVLVTLQYRNQAGLNSFLASIATPGNPAYGSKLSSAQFVAAYAPTTSQAQSVAAYLKSAGFANIKISDNNLLVSGDATAAQAQTAFNTSITRYQVAGQTVYTNTLPAQVPDSFNGVVNAVLGLQNAGHLNFNHPMPLLSGTSSTSKTSPADTAPAPAAQAMLPPFEQVAYDAQSTPTAANTIGAIFMEGDVSTVLSDFQLMEQMNNQPQIPVMVVNTDPASTDVSGADEFDLDSQSSSSIAGTFKQMIWYVASSLDDAPIEAQAAQWVTDDLAPSASFSVGGCESVAALSGFQAALDATLKQAEAQGQTLFASSGDTGNVCLGLQNGLNLGVPGVEYPGSSTYAVSVGGTVLSTNADFSYGSETSWANGGGGYSLFETAPAWQSSVAPLAALGRSVPDIAMDAAPSTGTVVLVSAFPEVVGGTSLSAPLAMGAWARMESAHDNSLGFAPPLFYALEVLGQTADNYSASITGFHDVTVTGTTDGIPNIPYEAGPGYDNRTGIGTYDICLLTGLLGGATNYCAAPATPPIGVGGVVTASTFGTDVCTAPGHTLLTGTGNGGVTSTTASQEATSIAVAEPASLPGKIVFTFGVGDLSALPADTIWLVLFATPDGVQKFVWMDTLKGATTPEFQYGFIVDNGFNFQTVGTLDAASSYSATDNTITLIADESVLGSVVPGNNLAYLEGQVLKTTNALPGRALEVNGAGSYTLASSTVSTFYTLRTAALCPASTGGSSSGGGSSSSSGGSGSSSSGGGSSGGGGGGAFGFPALFIVAGGALLRRRRERAAAAR